MISLDGNLFENILGTRFYCNNSFAKKNSKMFILRWEKKLHWLQQQWFWRNQYYIILKWNIYLSFSNNLQMCDNRAFEYKLKLK